MEELTKRLKNVDTRTRLRSHLREFIESIQVYSVGFKKLYDGNELQRLREEARQPTFTRKRGQEVSNKAGALTHADLAEIDYRNNTEGLAEYIQEKGLELAVKTPFAFLRWVTEQRMSKAGRFLRLKFKTGKVVDLVPPGSIATGRSLGSDGRYNLALPPLDKLMKTWYSASRKGRGNRVVKPSIT